ncbi:MAG: hypothetical protein HQL81_07190 [Magnetococcales bacterium]|nr:hypothetical protein [Magnetococcales bacterium]
MPAESIQKSGTERVLILAKALPHLGKSQGELVCCAGVTEEGTWRRQYPVRFRFMQDDKKFKRWQWVSYEWKLPQNDKRTESRRINEETVFPEKEMKSQHRAAFLQPLLVATTSEAEKRQQSLTLIRPEKPVFSWIKKSQEQIASERTAYANAVKQLELDLSGFSEEKRALDPCPYEFHYQYTTRGQSHSHQCLDWETSATFYNWKNKYGEEKALTELKRIFGEKYPAEGMAFVMGTHSRHPKTWLLIGVLKLNQSDQLSLF